MPKRHQLVAPRLFFAFLIIVTGAMAACDQDSPRHGSSARDLADSPAMTVIKNNWKITETDTCCVLWRWAATIQNNSGRDAKITVRYQLFDKDGMIVADSPEWLSIKAGQTQTATSTGNTLIEVFKQFATSQVKLEEGTDVILAPMQPRKEGGRVR